MAECTGFTQEWEKRIDEFTGMTEKESKDTFAAIEKQLAGDAKVIAQQNINAARFYLMRRMEGIDYLGETFGPVTMDEAINASEEMLERYVQAYADKAAQNAQSGHNRSYWEKSLRNLIIENKTMARPSYLNVLLAIGFGLNEADDFLLRVSGETLNLKEVGTAKLPGDLIYAFVFGIGGTYKGNVVPLRSSIAEISFPSALKGRETVDGTILVNDEFAQLLQEAGMLPENQRNDKFVEWVEENKDSLCTNVSNSAAIIFGKLLSMIAEKNSGEGIRTGRADPEGNRALEKEIKKEICMPLLGGDGEDTLNYLKPYELEQILGELEGLECMEVWSYVTYDGTSRNLNSEHKLDRTKLGRLATGQDRVTRNDLMLAMWCLWQTHWSRVPGDLKKVNAAARMKYYRNSVNEVLKKAMMPKMYAPHMMEYTLLTSVREGRNGPDYFETLRKYLWEEIRRHERGEDAEDEEN